tara:strand:- start:23906 stop:24703 length:798 start_codon:yes stop_codon:yes gene_type:complete
MKKKKLALLNLFSVILVIGVNAASQILRFNDTTNGEVSYKYFNLFTPADYAFAIWGVIFLGLIAYSVFQVRRAFFSHKNSDFIEQTGYWFALANFLTTAWVFAFTYEYIGLSVLIMIGILVSLLKVVINTNMERWDAPLKVIAFVWWPICFYSGWIAVATIANIASFLVKIDFAGSHLNQIVWTMIMITITVFINMLMINLRNMREFALVGAWALFALFIKHNGSIDAIAYYALCGSILLIIAAGIHGYKNRDTSPVAKLKKRSN